VSALPSRPRTPIGLAVIGIALALSAAVAVAGAQRERIAIVTSSHTEPYQRVVEGFRAYMSAQGVTSGFSFHSLQDDREAARKALGAARRSADSIVLTIGSVATQDALQSEGSAPVVACMIMNDHDLRRSAIATGVTLEFSLDTQFQWIKRFVPRGKSIGVLYNPRENQAQVDAAKRVAESHGLRLVARPVESPQALPAALASLSNDVDVVWGLSDQLVLSAQTGEAILLFSFRNRIPFAGLSESWVRAGALYALDRDYVDIGAQCGELALRVLRGTAPRDLPPARPRRLTYAINLRAAEHMNLDVSEDLIEGAKQVFR